MKTCRDCKHTVSEQALACPNCGAPYPAREQWDGWGFGYKSSATFLGLPLLHVSFKYRSNRMPVPAKGVIAIGQFAMGIITISQFGLGVISLGQFAIAGFAVAQFVLAYSLIAQMGVYIHKGHGQLVRSIGELLCVLITPCRQGNETAADESPLVSRVSSAVRTLARDSNREESCRRDSPSGDRTFGHYCCQRAPLVARKRSLPLDRSLPARQGVVAQSPGVGTLSQLLTG